MSQILHQLRERRTKALAKIERAEKALDSARSELSDVDAALRIVGEIEGVPPPIALKTGPSEAVAERQLAIVALLGEGRANAREPKELHARYVSRHKDEISLDTFRTTIWRMKERGPFDCEGRIWAVDNYEGRYWRERLVANGENPEALARAPTEDEEKEPPTAKAGGSYAVSSSAPPLELTMDHSIKGEAA